MPEVPALAVTATATKEMPDDIIEMLKMNNAKVTKMNNAKVTKINIDRSNIYMVFKEKTNIWDDIKQYVTAEDDGNMIIYVLQKAKADEISRILETHGV